MVASSILWCQYGTGADGSYLVTQIVPFVVGPVNIVQLLYIVHSVPLKFDISDSEPVAAWRRGTSSSNERATKFGS
jgi:hypothetical protein